MMKQKHGLKRVFIIAVAGALTLTGAGTAFAANSGAGEGAERFKAQRGNFEAWSTIYPAALESLTYDGTITQEQADAISKAMSSAADKTDETADRPARPERAAAAGETVEKPDGKKTTDGTAGTRGEGTRPEGGRMKGMHQEGTGSERTGFHAGLQNSPLSELVSDDILTQEEADAVMEALKEARTSGETCDEILDTLVSEEVITQEQADAIADAKPVLGGNGSGGMHRNLLSELITDGTITQEQADAVWDAVKTAMEAARDEAKAAAEEADDATE
ncbi:hypothetical protein FRZ06_18215 [Anoxybacterium hadale]|uniref:Uncharacterized protein n=1 Tax=Anoxybacterium hadale TaxID=3408580 RepID=A0ACD1AFX7_9FIRM|nr:hypothetical protein FRZ06_18215 [Clostridiales bacterium]